jgi:hypothetical protein
MAGTLHNAIPRGLGSADLQPGETARALSISQQPQLSVGTWSGGSRRPTIKCARDVRDEGELQAFKFLPLVPDPLIVAIVF